MTTSYEASRTSMAQRWHDFWRGSIGEWIITRGLQIVLLLIFAMLAARFINWAAQQDHPTASTPDFRESDRWCARRAPSTGRRSRRSSPGCRSRSSFVVVVVEITDVLAVPVGSLVAPAAVLGAALGFGAQRMVQDLLVGLLHHHREAVRLR